MPEHKGTVATVAIKKHEKRSVPKLALAKGTFTPKLEVGDLREP